jgi:hypothetical protein
MLKNILKLEGAQQLSKNEQIEINGAGAKPYKIDYCVDGMANSCPYKTNPDGSLMSPSCELRSLNTYVCVYVVY